MQTVAARLWWEGARRNGTRVARRLDRKQDLDGLYRLDAGAGWGAGCHVLEEWGVWERMAQVRGMALEPAMIPGVPAIRRDGVQTWGGMECLKARPGLLGREAARLRWVGCQVHHAPHWVCQRGAATRQGPRPEGALCPEAPAHTRVKRPRRDPAALRNGRLQALAQAAAGEEVTSGRRVLTVRHGQGRTTWAERLETAVVGIAGLTTCDQYGTVDHRHHHNRRDFQPNPIHAVVVRKWNGRDYGPGGKTVFLTNATVTKPLQPFDGDRNLIENCRIRIKEAKQQWDLGHPPQKTERAVWVHVVFTLLLVRTGHRVSVAV